MFASEQMNDDIHVVHVYEALPDPLLGFHLKRMCYSRNWGYQSRSIAELSNMHLRSGDVVVLDFFARPLRHAALRNELQLLQTDSEASFLLVFPRTFSSGITPLRGVNCEYCFLGLDGIEEITLRVDLVRARTEQFSHACDAVL